MEDEIKYTLKYKLSEENLSEFFLWFSRKTRANILIVNIGLCLIILELIKILRDECYQIDILIFLVLVTIIANKGLNKLYKDKRNVQ
jgi:hypothetical protein